MFGRLRLQMLQFASTGNPSVSMLDAFKQQNMPVVPTVLLAEDDEDLREVTEWTLSAMGYIVVACHDAQHALIAFQSHRNIDVLLTDFEMPGLSGVELARELTSLCPTLPVMIITGSILPDAIMQEINDRHWTYISKPCNLTSLGASLRGILTSRQSAA